MGCAYPHFLFEIRIFFCIMQFIIKREFFVEKTITTKVDWKFRAGLIRRDSLHFILKLKHWIHTTNGITECPRNSSSFHPKQIKRWSMLALAHRFEACSRKNL